MGKIVMTRSTRQEVEFIKALSMQFLGRSPDESLVENLLSKQSYEEIIEVIQSSTEHRLNQQRLSSRYLPPAPPQRVVFEHIMKTGGTTINSVLTRLFPLHVVSPHLTGEQLSPDHAVWPVVTGHLGKDSHSKLPDLNSRKKLTLLRHPHAWIMSGYRYWRYDVGPEHAGYRDRHVTLARELPFSEFIREVECLENHQAQCIGYGGQGSPSDALAYFDVVGTTDNLEDFLVRALRCLGVEQALSAKELISLVPHNRSSGKAEPLSTKDADHIGEHWALDLALYECALRQSRLV